MGPKVYKRASPWWLSGKEPAFQCRRWGSNPWVGKIPCRRKRLPVQYSCLGNPMDRGTWWATVHRITKSRTQWLKQKSFYTFLGVFQRRLCGFPRWVRGKRIPLMQEIGCTNFWILNYIKICIYNVKGNYKFEKADNIIKIKIKKYF